MKRDSSQLPYNVAVTLKETLALFSFYLCAIWQKRYKFNLKKQKTKETEVQKQGHDLMKFKTAFQAGNIHLWLHIKNLCKSFMFISRVSFYKFYRALIFLNVSSKMDTLSPVSDV